MHPYQNPNAAIDTRVEDLLARMTPAEKIAQLHAMWLILDEEGHHRVRGDAFIKGTEAETLRERLLLGLGQITRPLGTAAVDPVKGVRALNRLQKLMVEETRLGIPVLSHEECLSGLMARDATLFPSSLGYGATWNPALIEKVGAAIGAEMASVGGHQGLAPVLDVARDARWGRTEETFGEDPYLVGEMALAYVKGLQGPDRKRLATLKHYVGHSFSEGARNHAPVHLGWRELNDDFMLPFEMAVKLGRASSVMPAYHDIDNEPVHASRHLLTDVLRGEWGFEGIVVADYIGVTLLHSHHGVASDLAEAAALAFRAGLDVELPADECATALGRALDRGLITMEEIDAILRRSLSEKFRIGLFEKPFADEGAIALRTPEALTLAREVAEQSVVILDNKGALPIAQGTRLAVIGPCADDPLALLGDYSFPVHLINMDAKEDASSVVTLRQGLAARFPVTYAKGCHILETRSAGAPVFPGDVADPTRLHLASSLSTRLDLIPEAVAAAKASDLAVVCLGDLSGIFQTGTVGEGSDAETLDLPGVQQQLLQAVVDTGVPVVALITSGRPYNLGGLESRLAAQVYAWFPGEQGGHAVARVLAGEVEPSGRLTLSVPRSAGAAPYFYNHKFKASGTPVARHFGSDYPFGHGLSYTSFTWQGLEVTEKTDLDGTVTAALSVTNIGPRPGTEVVQLYIRDRLASLVRPVKELKAFAKLDLAPGETKRVTFDIPTDMLNFTGYQGHRIVEPGWFDILLGASSADIRLRGEVELTGPAPKRLPRDWRMQSRATGEEAGGSSPGGGLDAPAMGPLPAETAPKAPPAIPRLPPRPALCQPPPHAYLKRVPSQKAAMFLRPLLPALLLGLALIPAQAPAQTGAQTHAVTIDLATSPGGVTAQALNAAIKEARRAFAKNPDTVFTITLPAGTFHLDDTIEINKIAPSDQGRLIIRGAGIEATTLVQRPDIPGIEGRALHHVTIEGMTFTLPIQSTTQGHVVSTGPAEVVIDIAPGFPTPDVLMDAAYAGKSGCAKADAASGSWGRFLKRMVETPTGPQFADPEQSYWKFCIPKEVTGRQWRFPLAVTDDATPPWQPGDLIAIKSKFMANAYHFCGGSDFEFKDIRWLQRSRGIWMCGFDQVHLDGVEVRRGPAIEGQRPALSSPGGGPQIGDLDHPSTGHLVENSVFEATGDDAIAFFAARGEIRDTTITDSFGRLNLNASDITLTRTEVLRTRTLRQ